MRERVDIGTYVVADPEICHGQVTFRGTRAPVDTVLYYVSQGYAFDELVRGWPQLTREAIQEAIVIASRALVDRYASIREQCAEPAS